MTVAQLIAVLQKKDPNAKVLLVTQPNYPIEHTLAGVAQDRKDVVLVAGDWHGYGARAAFDAPEVA